MAGCVTSSRSWRCLLPVWNRWDHFGPGWAVSGCLINQCHQRSSCHSTGHSLGSASWYRGAGPQSGGCGGHRTSQSLIERVSGTSPAWGSQDLGTQARVPWEASAFPLSCSLNKQPKNALSCARRGRSSAESLLSYQLISPASGAGRSETVVERKGMSQRGEADCFPTLGSFPLHTDPPGWAVTRGAWAGLGVLPVSLAQAVLLGGNSRKRLRKFPVGLFRLEKPSRSLSPSADPSPPGATSTCSGFCLKFGCLRSLSPECCVSRVIAGWFLGDVLKS